MALNLPVVLSDVVKAQQCIRGYIHKTPIFTSLTANNTTGRQLFFKAENLQKTGSFKARGALNAIFTLKEHNPNLPGIVTHSSGNHGQAVAWAARAAGLPCTVVVPHYSPAVKKQGIAEYGASLFECGPKPTDRNEACDKIATEKGYSIVPPFDHVDVIAGQGTIALELLEEVPDLDAILVPVSGGGMISGIAIAAKARNPKIRIYAVEPDGKILGKCLTEGQRLWPEPPQYLDTIADGIRLQQVGHITFPIMCQLVEPEVFTVTNEDIIEGMKFTFQRMKLVVEAASGAAVAAALSQKMKKMDPSIKKVGVILCGGNVDIEKLPWY